MIKTNFYNLLKVTHFRIISLGCAILMNVVVLAEEHKPDNRALLYYQAFLLCPDRDDIPIYVRQKSSDLSVEEVEKLRKYMKDYQHVIQLLEAASSAPRCDMAIPRSQWNMAHEVELKLMRCLTSAAVLIGANVRVLTADGDYRTALSQSLMLRRVAWDIVDDHFLGFNELILVSKDRASMKYIRLVLDVMPPDEKTLRWLSERLSKAPRISDVRTTRIKQRYDYWLQRKRQGKTDVLRNIRQKLAEKAKDDAQKREALALTDNEVIELMRKPYEKFIQSAIVAMESEMSYEQRKATLESLRKEFDVHAEGNPAITFPMLIFVDNIVDFYNVQVADTRWSNAFEAAVQIYLVKATTGRLPEKVPEDFPKDPLTGKEFIYKVTDEGFLLTHPAKYSNWPEFKFKVQTEQG